jgi:hypothetical protein
MPADRIPPRRALDAGGQGVTHLYYIRVLHLGLFRQDHACDLRNDAPLATVASRSVPLACGPNVDHAARWRTFMLPAIAALRR